MSDDKPEGATEEPKPEAAADAEKAAADKAAEEKAAAEKAAAEKAAADKAAADKAAADKAAADKAAADKAAADKAAADKAAADKAAVDKAAVDKAAADKAAEAAADKAAADKAAAEKAAKAKAGPPGSARGKLLLVAWGPSPAGAWEAQLAHAGYEVTVERSARINAFQFANEQQPVAIVIDLSQNPDDGKRLATTLRITGATAGIPFVFCDAVAGGAAPLTSVEAVLSALGKL